MSNYIFDKLQEDGYVVIEDFLTPEECAELVQAGKELSENIPDTEEKAIFSTINKDKQLKDAYFLNSNDKISFFFEENALNEDGTVKVDQSRALNKIGHALHILHPLFRCYTYCDRVKAVCRQIGLREPSVVQSMIIFKHPEIGGAVSAHQDATYLYTTPIPPIGFWIALEDATTQNGCLWIARGSHQSGVHRRLVRNPDKDSSETLIYDKPAPVYRESSFTAVPVKKGTCILLHGNVVHKSAANKSMASRAAYTFHVVERHNNQYSSENWLQEGSNAPFCNVYETEQYI